MLKGLHISSLTNSSSMDPTYDPLNKIREFKNALEERFRLLCEPGRNLSVDETLLRVYGRLSFKVRVVTKAARYGIKMYVCTDSTDAYVLSTSMYTGAEKSPEVANDLKKTTNVVLDLVKPYNGTQRSIKTDRYYTSVELAVNLKNKTYTILEQ